MNFVSFKSKPLRGLFEKDSRKGLDPSQIKRLQKMFTALTAAPDMASLVAPPGWALHELQGDRKGTFSMSVTGNWRLTFRVENNEIADVDLEDYH